MVCPNCSETLQPVYMDNQYINHCGSCGCSFFEENGINRITYDSARTLSENKYRKFVSPKAKHCPIDFATLVPISNTESVPSHITLFVCPSCSGVLVYPEDLVKFKKAQGAKIDYYKSWGKPFASLQAVLIVLVIMVLSASSYLTITTINNRALYKSEASDLFKSLSIAKSGRYIILSFKTNTPFKSQILLINDRTKGRALKGISNEFKKAHEVVISDVDPYDPYSYRIILTDKNGKSLETGLKKLVVTGRN